MMEKTWRWFGKKDKITLPMLRQIGVKGIVTALHDVPNGEIWTMEAINDLKSYIESYGLRWSVVESLPVCEAIKYAGAEREQLIENYKVSLANLGKCGIKTVCYNFMPVIDWIRTDLQHPWPDGTYIVQHGERKYDEKIYLWPLPSDDVLIMNGKLVQNPGY
jgi:mannonate dehydratase